jgi:hypothetical protein
MGEACSCGAWVGRQEAHTCPESAAVTELSAMMLSITAGWRSYFGMGKFACKRKLSNGAVVRVSITMPPVQAGEESK